MTTTKPPVLTDTPRTDALTAQWDDDGATRGPAYMEMRDLARLLEIEQAVLERAGADAVPVARVAGDDVSRYLDWDKDRSAWEMPVGTPVYYSPCVVGADAVRDDEEPVQTLTGTTWLGMPVAAWVWDQKLGEEYRAITGEGDNCIRRAAFHWSTGPSDAERTYRESDVRRMLAIRALKVTPAAAVADRDEADDLEDAAIRAMEAKGDAVAQPASQALTFDQWWNAGGCKLVNEAGDKRGWQGAAEAGYIGGLLASAAPQLSGNAGEVQALATQIKDDLQCQFDTDGITEIDSGDALIRLSEALNAVDDAAIAASKGSRP